MGSRGKAPGLLLLLSLLVNTAQANECKSLTKLVDTTAPAGAEFLPSYPTAQQAPALRGTAFVYDNSLAVIALLACGERARAGRIGRGVAYCGDA